MSLGIGGSGSQRLDAAQNGPRTSRTDPAGSGEAAKEASPAAGAAGAAQNAGALGASLTGEDAYTSKGKTSAPPKKHAPGGRSKALGETAFKDAGRTGRERARQAKGSGKTAGRQQDHGLQCLSIPPFRGKAVQKLDEEFGRPFHDFLASHAPEDTRFRMLITDASLSAGDSVGSVVSMYSGSMDSVYPKNFPAVEWDKLDAKEVARQMHHDFLQMQGLRNRWDAILKSNGGLPPKGSASERELREVIGVMTAYGDRFGDGASELHRRGLT
jgi:hypothetical protein